MLLVKINFDFYVVVSDDKPANGDYCIHLTTKNITQQRDERLIGDWKKILFSTRSLFFEVDGANAYPGVLYISLYQVHKILGLYHPLDEAKVLYPPQMGKSRGGVRADANQEKRDAFVEGWLRAHDNLGGDAYGRTDLVNVAGLARSGKYKSLPDGFRITNVYEFDYPNIEQLVQSCIVDVWEVEFNNNIFKLKK